MKKGNSWLFLIITILTSYCVAGTLNVNPTSILLSKSHQIGVLTISNPTDTGIYLQVKPLRWTQNNGHNDLSPTHDLYIFPAIFKIDAGKSQIVRFAINGSIDGQTEKQYRVLIKEIIEKNASQDSQGLQIHLNILLPVFVEPDKITQGLIWSIKKNVLTVYNHGNAYNFINHWEIKRNQKILLQEKNIFLYILPEQKFKWHIKNFDTKNTYIIATINGQNTTMQLN